MARLRVLLADDHAVLREGLAMLIDAQPDMQVVAHAATAAEAIRRVQAQAIDLVVMDVSLPDGGGAQAAQAIRMVRPHVRVLALTRHADPSYVPRLLQAGASGYVLKKSAADTLIAAMREVARGGSYVEPELAVAATRTTLRTPVREAARLTRREEEVLREVAWGRSSKEIGGLLAISTKTVESYKAAAVDKLQLRSRTDIVRYAVARGWLAEDVAPDE